MKKLSLDLNNFLIQVIFYFILIISIGCSAHTNLVPIGKGNIDGSLSLGGPFIPLAETKIPTPYLSVGANYGLREKINLDANFHLTPLFYKLTGFDFGSTWFPILNDGIIPSWGVQPRMLFLASYKDNISSRFRVYPLISNSAAWKLGEGLIYSGLDLVIPLTSADYDKESVKIIFSPFMGYRWNLGKNIGLFTEIKWHGANVQSSQLAVEYISVGEYGALSLILSLEKRL